jgi:hypothetical protein
MWKENGIIINDVYLLLFYKIFIKIINFNINDLSSGDKEYESEYIFLFIN